MKYPYFFLRAIWSPQSKFLYDEFDNCLCNNTPHRPETNELINCYDQLAAPKDAVSQQGVDYHKTPWKFEAVSMG